MIKGFCKYYYVIKCDVCGKSEVVERDFDHGVYNGAQAVRSLGWSYGRDKRVMCKDCRIGNIRQGFIFCNS